MADTKNLFSKMNDVKKDFLAANVKKTGKNKHSGFEYYELSDLQPVLTDLCAKHNIYQHITFTADLAIMTVINIDNPQERIEFTSPMREISIAGCNAIQSLGGVETYQRRYLLLTAYDITEPDLFDATAGTPANREDGITSEQIQWIKDHCDVAAMLAHFNKPNLLQLSRVEANAVITAKKRQLEKEDR